MRYDTPIYFQRNTPGEYDPTTGDYKPDTLNETLCYASVTDSGIETLRLVYGEIKQGSYTIRLQRSYTESFDCIRIGAKTYHADMARLNKRVFVVSEVQ